MRNLVNILDLSCEEIDGLVRLASDIAPIDGGIILRCGPVETNCSLAMLMAENRRETEAKVSRILFGDAN